MATARLLSLCLDLAQVLVETIEAFLPETPILLDPISRVLERRRFQPARSPLGLPPPADQPRSLEHLEMFRDGGKAHVERLRQFGDRKLAHREAGEDRPSGGIGQRRESGAESIR